MAISNHKISNSPGGDYACSGSMGNPMYLNIHNEGVYVHNSERKHRRADERRRKRRSVMKKFQDTKPRGFM